jgi:hypothetical protein
MEETNKNKKLAFSKEAEIRTMVKDIARLRRTKPQEKREKAPDLPEDIARIRTIEAQKEKEKRGKEEILKLKKRAEEKPPIKRTVPPQPPLPPIPSPPPLTPSPSPIEERKREEEEKRKRQEEEKGRMEEERKGGKEKARGGEKETRGRGKKEARGRGKEVTLRKKRGEPGPKRAPTTERIRLINFGEEKAN